MSSAPSSRMSMASLMHVQRRAQSPTEKFIFERIKSAQLKEKKERLNSVKLLQREIKVRYVMREMTNEHNLVFHPAVSFIKISPLQRKPNNKPALVS